MQMKYTSFYICWTD